MIKIANDKINKIMLGNDEIARVYLGNDLIYQNKKWVFQKEDTWAYYIGYKNLISFKEGSHLFVLKEGEMLNIDVISGGKMAAYGAIRSNDKFGSNANVIIYKDKKVTIKRGNFNTDTKTFTPEYTMSRDKDCIYIPHFEISGGIKSSAKYEYYILE